MVTDYLSRHIYPPVDVYFQRKQSNIYRRIFVSTIQILASNAFLIRKAQNKKIPPGGGTFCFCLLGAIPKPQ